MKLKLFQVDAFTDLLFAGNPAAVLPLEAWLPEELMQKIAAENNLSETAFFVPNKDSYDLRWFTPSVEINLCGHATLASAHVLFHHLGFKNEELLFHSKSGPLMVRKEGDWLTLNFPMDELKQVDTPAIMFDIVHTKPLATFMGRENYLVVLRSQSEVQALIPDFNLMMRLQGNGVIVTARGEDVDFVSRYFAPKIDIKEDPVTGAAHTSLIPYWANELKKSKLTARQLSARGGYLECKAMSDRVEMSGKAVTYLEGEISVRW